MPPLLDLSHITGCYARLTRCHCSISDNKTEIGHVAKGFPGCLFSETLFVLQHVDKAAIAAKSSIMLSDNEIILF